MRTVHHRAKRIVIQFTCITVTQTNDRSVLFQVIGRHFELPINSKTSCRIVQDKCAGVGASTRLGELDLFYVGLDSNDVHVLSYFLRKPVVAAQTRVSEV